MRNGIWHSNVGVITPTYNRYSVNYIIKNYITVDNILSGHWLVFLPLLGAPPFVGYMLGWEQNEKSQYWILETIESPWVKEEEGWAY